MYSNSSSETQVVLIKEDIDVYGCQWLEIIKRHLSRLDINMSDVQIEII